MNNKITPKIQDSIDFLDLLCQQEIIAYPIEFEAYHSSDFELSKKLKCWLGGNDWSKEGYSFVQFGQDGTGSLFLLWFYPSLQIDPPVVFLGSDGESCLIASNIDDFIRQLGSGKLFYLGNWIDPEEDKLDWQKLKSSIENKFGQSKYSPEEIGNRAKELHPDFTLWFGNTIDY